MSVRQQISVDFETHATARAIHILTGESYGAIVSKALDVLLANDKDLARKVEDLRKAMAA